MQASENENMPISEAEPVLHIQSALGEGSVWNPISNQLYWVDIEGCTFNVYDPESCVNTAFPTGARVGSVVPANDGNALLAMQTGIHHIDIRTGKLTLLVNPITARGVRFNDGKCDPSGRFWAGTMALNKTRGAGSLYRYDRDGSIHEMYSGVTISNGIVWTADRRTMYYIDTPTSCVLAFDYEDESGNISNGRIAFSIPPAEGFPDGMSIDADDKLWIAMWGAGAVRCYDPLTGNILHLVEVPAPHVASCAFGGADLRTLYITTARVELTADELERYPASGDLFMARPGAQGVAANLYRMA